MSAAAWVRAYVLSFALGALAGRYWDAGLTLVRGALP
jgi:hypothetical protein